MKEIVMLDTIGTITGSTAIMINLVGFGGALPLSTRGRMALAAGVGGWVGLATAAASSGALAFTPEQPVPLVGLFFALPPITVAALWFTSKAFREALLAIPTSLLVGLNSMRMLGALFLGLTAVGRLSGPFPYSAGIGDIITGAMAVPLALALTRGSTGLESRVRSWNIFGALDLFAAVGLGLISGQGGPLQILHVGVGSEAMQYLPFALIPTVLVPFYLITHGIVAAQLATRRRSKENDGQQHAAGAAVSIA
jgi:hypothetical protein